MHKKTFIPILIALSLSMGGLSFAQGRGNDDDGPRGQGHRNGPAERQHDRGHKPTHHQDRAHQQDRRERERQANNVDHRGERGAGPNHAFRRGERLPLEYRHRQYVVNDWRGHRLSPPPRGYHWVQTGGDYVLVAISSGIILQIFLGN